MEGLTRLVDASLARHGLRPRVDHRRLTWSRWFRCESSFGMWLVPNQPGLFALGEEVLAPDDQFSPGEKRMLAVFQISEAKDLGAALDRLFVPSHPLFDRIATGRCFTRYAVIPDVTERAACLAAFQKWLHSSAETASAVHTSGAGSDLTASAGEWPVAASDSETDTTGS